jgi:hypothetical protein
VSPSENRKPVREPGHQSPVSACRVQHVAESNDAL